eukprot:TRINITY_DN18764_c0_g1_i2.p1 TRINITY_DN18764_c0_g1~~TRINITY_DN18764_c0_g1_i2.p1  ORF type:complete len:222 (-),score=39.44 TRINITY_DN18764_c0_g1_i2:51-716(-)
MWRSFPPQVIPPQSAMSFGSESLGLPYATEGTVMYQISQNQGPFVFRWEVPFISSPRVEAQYDDKLFEVKHTIKTSKGFAVTFTIRSLEELQTNAEFLTIPPLVYDSWKIELKSAQKSVLVTLKNESDLALRLTKCSISGGILRSPIPMELKSNTTVEFGAETHMGGTEGVFAYTDDSGTISKFRWKISPLPKSQPEFIPTNFEMEILLPGDQTEILLVKK